MDQLEAARRQIDAVDAQLADLFEQRMAAVLQVAEYKKAHGLPIFDPAREAAVLDKAAARIHSDALRPYYRDHVRRLMDLAKAYEAQQMGCNRVAYQGVEGAFAPHSPAGTVPPRGGAGLPHLGRCVRRCGAGGRRLWRAAL